jgi:O-antigen/teichoic acid export membrane protein
MEDDNSLNPTEEINLETVKKRAVKGVVVLTSRTFILSILSLIATGFLTVFLDPSQFGVFWIVSAVVNFLAYFSDVGLAAALIQKKEEIQSQDLKTTFFVQQVLVVLLLLILFATSPLLVRVYSLSYEGKLLLYSLGISLFLSSLKTIPSVLLERDLEFGKLVVPQILENLVYNILAVLARGMVGLVAMYVLKPWRPGLAFCKESIKKLLKFGVPYQANTLLATLKDDGMTVVLGGILGTSGVGLLGWAQKWAQAPLRFFMDHVIKVTFPAFSRMQEAKDHLVSAVERSIFFICFLVFPSLAGLLIVAPVLVVVIPKYLKWQPAIIPLYLIAINTLFASVTTQLTNLLNAIGKIKTTFKLMIMWTVLTWLFVPILAIKYQVVGASFGYALVGVSSVVAVIIARRYIQFSLYRSVVKPFVSALVMSAVLLTARSMLSVSFSTVVILAGLGILVYGITICVLAGSSIKDDVTKSLKIFLSRI